ncbi:MAG TPA: protein kinase [Gemmatimonadaceae bacterium]|nr:protein kinase [Gemmatimonadaceae bacterium]
MLPAPTVDPLFLAFQSVLTGRYSIDRELGRGGMGIVFLAREVHLDRLVAIKLLPPERGREPGFKERFLREARLAAKLSHPNIIPIHSVEAVGEFVFYVMAFVDGETLANRVRTRGPLSSSEGARVLREVAWALAYAHGQGLIHRDVKPDNILLEHSTNRVLVADFGIAAAAGDATDISGTPEFMSPEQALGKPLDARSDLYGLGATAFFAFSGRFPFEGKSTTEILAKQVTEAPPPVSSLGLTVPRKVASVIDRCLAKDPAQRPANAQALGEQLSVAIEQRREMPAALRAFVKRYGRLDGGGTLLAGMGLLPASVAVSMMLGAAAGFTTIFLGGVAAPFAYFVWAARRLLKQGFSYADIGPAYTAEMDQAREELSAAGDLRASRMESGVKEFIKASLALSVLTFGVRFFWILFLPRRLYGAFNWMDPIAPVALGSAVLGTMFLVALKQRHSDVDTAFWARIWRSRAGRLAFSLAKKLLGGKPRHSALTHRATELSLGMAAEELYEGLPREIRRALGDIPVLLTRLQRDAQALRKQHDALQEALGDVRDAAGSDDYAELAALRVETQSRLTDAVGSLETIRLNLLRLHAGSATIEGVTTHLGIAAEVSEQVERLIAAHQDIEKHINFPRRDVATPV